MGPEGFRPDRRIAAIATTIAASPPFISVAPRPYSLPFSMAGANGSRVQPGPAGTTSECPRNIHPGPSPPSNRATRLGLPGRTSVVSTASPASVHAAASTSTVRCSVPPGFSLSAAMRSEASAVMSSTSILPAIADASDPSGGPAVRLLTFGRRTVESCGQPLDAYVDPFGRGGGEAHPERIVEVARRRQGGARNEGDAFGEADLEQSLRRCALIVALQRHPQEESAFRVGGRHAIAQVFVDRGEHGVLAFKVSAPQPLEVGVEP